MFNSVGEGSRLELSSYLESKLGIDTPYRSGQSRYQETWRIWADTIHLRDLLSAITYTVKFMNSRNIILGIS